MAHHGDLRYSRAGRAASPPANTPLRGRALDLSSAIVDKELKAALARELMPRCLSANRSRLLTPLPPAGVVDIGVHSVEGNVAVARVVDPLLHFGLLRHVWPAGDRRLPVLPISAFMAFAS